MNRSIAIARQRILQLVAAATVAAMIFGNVASVSAASITSASLELGDSRTSETSTYTVGGSSFTTGTTIRCVEVVLNDQADGGGSIPSNITTTSSTLDSSTLITAGSWSVDNSTNGTLSITNAAGETPSASGNIVWGTVTNGDTDQTYYALIDTYSDLGCSTGVDSTVIAFAYKDGTLVSLTLEPTLLFVCNSVASAQTVNGATTSLLSGATGIDFGTAVTTSTNGITAHDLDVTTNASGGYNVYIRHTGQLINAATDVIANHTGTNASPTSFPAPGTEAWGYTTEDADLVQFGANEWAGFTTSNEVVMTNAAATAGSETVRVGHQVGVQSDTPAGTYTTTMIYTIVATY